MVIGFGVDFAEAATVQTFVERMSEALSKQAAACDDPQRADGIRDAIAALQEAAKDAGLRDHGAGLGVPVMRFDAVDRNGREIIPAITFAAGKRID